MIENRGTPAPVVAALRPWLKLRGAGVDARFTPAPCSGVAVLRPVSAQSVYELLQRRARQAGVAALSPHDLRRTLTPGLLDAGADVAAVQKILGTVEL